jgi:hypothetical protein
MKRYFKILAILPAVVGPLLKPGEPGQYWSDKSSKHMLTAAGCPGSKTGTRCDPPVIAGTKRQNNTPGEPISLIMYAMSCTEVTK